MPQSAVDQVKERLNIVDVIGQYVKLTKSGKNYKGLSPFKKEKTPSFYVNPDKGMYYDFSSGQGGDVFTFVQEMEGVDFKGALKVLAERANIDLHPEPKGKRDQRDRLFGSLEDACRFFETKLMEDDESKAYLLARGVSEATMRRFRLGLAREGWTILHDYLTGSGYHVRDLEQAGLVKRGEQGRYYDRFRSRIMFPIMDPAGRVIAFSGRIVGRAADDKENAKYLNSPETELFDKGRTLYGYDKAKHAIRTNDFAILVEGQMDLVLSHQVGYANTVAISGTGLTHAHLELIGRATKRIVLAFDADSAGEASVERAATLALERGFDVKVARVPVGKDPADCIVADSALWKKAVRDAQHVVVHTLFDVCSHETDTRKRMLRVRDRVLPLVARIPSALEQAHFIHVVADKLDVDDASVRDDVRSAAKALSQERTNPVRTQPSSPPRAVESVRSQERVLERSLAGLLFWQDEQGSLLAADEVKTFCARYDIDLGPILARFAHERDALMFEAEEACAKSEKPKELFVTLLKRYTLVLLDARRSHIAKVIREYERRGEMQQADEQLAAFTALAHSMENLRRELS